MTSTTEKPEREVKIVEKSKDAPDWVPPFTVYVDGCYRGDCSTRAKAERAAKMEAEAPASQLEVAIMRMKAAGIDQMDGVSCVEMSHTGGGCLAAGIYFEAGATKEEGAYIWVTDDDLGHSEAKPNASYAVGIYSDPDTCEWDEDLSGDAKGDEAMVAMVRAGVEALTA